MLPDMHAVGIRLHRNAIDLVNCHNMCCRSPPAVVAALKVTVTPPWEIHGPPQRIRTLDVPIWPADENPIHPLATPDAEHVNSIVMHAWVPEEIRPRAIDRALDAPDAIADEHAREKKMDEYESIAVHPTRDPCRQSWSDAGGVPGPWAFPRRPPCPQLHRGGGVPL